MHRLSAGQIINGKKETLFPPISFIGSGRAQDGWPISASSILS